MMNIHSMQRFAKPETERFKRAGFTLVELIVVIVIIGIIALVGSSRFADKNVFANRGFNDAAVAALRYAHQSAIAQRRLVCVEFTTNSISLKIAGNFDHVNCGNLLLEPLSGKPYVLDPGSMTGDVRFVGTPNNFNFLPSGEASADVNFKVSGMSQSIRVVRRTGYVYVQ